MKVTVYTDDQGDVSVGAMPDENVAALLEEFGAGEPVLAIALHGGGVAHVATAHVTRIDVDPERHSLWARFMSAARLTRQ